MKHILVDAISNVRVAAGVIRMDLMNISGQDEEGKYLFEKSSELAMTSAAFSQALRTFQEVDKELRERVAEQNKNQQETSTN
ncbi:hypothetical protein N9P07_03855 [Alphaproteobacteria bacterium]|nr:hypothetical protein [Alphaproteobacteria bacterium]